MAFENLPTVMQARFMQESWSDISEDCAVSMLAGLMSMGNVTCAEPSEMIDVCVAGDDTECDAIAEMIDSVLCVADAYADAVADAECTEGELSFATNDLYSSVLEELENSCDPDEIAHVCITEGTLDLAALVEEAQTAQAGGSTPSEEDSTDDDDSAAGLVAFAGVSLAAAAMLA